MDWRTTTRRDMAESLRPGTMSSNNWTVVALSILQTGNASNKGLEVVKQNEKDVVRCSERWLYSGRAEHFWTKGAPILPKKIFGASVHEGTKYACNQCNYQVTYKSLLKFHIKSKHEGVKYACNQCEYQAIHLYNLKRHIQTRHDSIKFPCDQCDRQLNSKDSLVMHKKAKH